MLIFDFDGVLMDSVHEVAVTAYNTLTDNIVTRLNQIPPQALDLFVRNRFHVQPIGDALVLMNWSLETSDSQPHKLLNEKDYEKILQQVEEPVDSRTARFFDRRSQFKAKDIDAWLALNEPVHPVWRLLLERPGGDLVMLTNKNREATVALCTHFGLEVSMTIYIQAIRAPQKSITLTGSCSGLKNPPMPSSMIPSRICVKLTRTLTSMKK